MTDCWKEPPTHVFPFYALKKNPPPFTLKACLLCCDARTFYYDHTPVKTVLRCVCVGGVWQRVHFAFTDGAPWRHRSHMVRRRAVIAHTHGPHGNPTQLISLRGTTGRPTSLQSDSPSLPPPSPLAPNGTVSSPTDDVPDTVNTLNSMSGVQCPRVCAGVNVNLWFHLFE